MWDQYARASGDDFTTVEKVEIARKIEDAMGNRQGERTDLDNVLTKSDKGKSADIAAAAVGMSGEQYRRAKIKSEILETYKTQTSQRLSL